MSVPGYQSQPYRGFQRDAPPIRRLTRIRTEVNATTTMVAGLPEIDPLSRPASFLRGMWRALLATAIFRCWHFIIFFTLEAFVVTWFYMHGRHIAIENTLMNVLGTVLGFVISYRSSASFDRYNEGRRYWSSVVYNIRMFARTVWFHIPDGPIMGMQMAPAKNIREYKARTLVEKKTVLNLLEAFAVALKHYLRGEEGTHYEDLYPLVKFLPAYSLPTGFAVRYPDPHTSRSERKRAAKAARAAEAKSTAVKDEGHDGLPMPATSNLKHRTPTSLSAPVWDEKEKDQFTNTNTAKSSVQETPNPKEQDNTIFILPSSNPPTWHIFDLWPFSLCVRQVQKNGRELKGRRALKDRARNKGRSKEGNVPLEITLYLSSYIATLQARGADGLSCGQMMGALSQLVDSLTGLERILTTPVPFSYEVHLWTVTLVWLLVLPFQILNSLKWLTVPGVALAAFVYCGLMKCAEELEDPFGYDYNDLNMDHFTHNIIRKELQALTSLPMPDPAKWAFSADNDAVFDVDGNVIYLDTDEFGERDQALHPEHLNVASPNEWVKRGEAQIRAALAKESDSDHNEYAPQQSPPQTHPAAVSLSSGSGLVSGGANNAAIGGGVMQPSGNHSFGGPGGAGLVAGSAIAAAGVNGIDPSGTAMFSSSPPPPAPGS